MTNTQIILTVAIIMAATMLTRFLSFLVFPAGKETPAFIQYLGKVLPAAAMAMLVIYCFKGVDITGGNHGAPELIAGVAALPWPSCTSGSTVCSCPLAGARCSTWC